MKISVIIAAYNAEKYLRQALNSIFMQTLPLKDYEVIIVDDGSTDSTSTIIEEYSKKYSNLQSLYQKNQGPAAARNFALKKAKGQYLYFFDADDIVDPDALFQMYTRATEQDADVLIAKYDIFNEYTISPVTNLDNLVKLDCISKYDPKLLWTFTLWNKLFKRELAIKENITFPLVSYSEDGVFTMRMILHSKKITGLDAIVLHYRRNYDLNATSITANIAPWKIKHFLKAHRMIEKEILRTMKKENPSKKIWRKLPQNKPALLAYYHEFQVKELHTIYNQFYSHYWNSDYDSRELTLHALKKKFIQANFATKQEILDRSPELMQLQKESFSNTKPSPIINLCLYGTPEQKEAFLATLASLCSSNYVFYQVTMPDCMREIVLENGLIQENFSYVPSHEDKISFYKKAIQSIPSTYALLTESCFLYTYNALSIVMKRLDREILDFGMETVYCKDPEQNSFFPDNTPDFLFANKIFRKSFLLPLLDLPLNQLFSKLYQTGYHTHFQHQTVLLIKPTTQEMFLIPQPDLSQ